MSGMLPAWLFLRGSDFPCACVAWCRQKRRCTDCFWLLILLVCWVAMTAIGLATTGVIESDDFDEGNPYRILRGIDYKGKLCGIDEPVEELSVSCCSLIVALCFPAVSANTCH